ncbi:MAG: hypothetical protein P1V51_17555 [Deltaproteobacteria bacterium]|nr:hypothetical protein [Deltaproteobacteria bacterium]
MNVRPSNSALFVLTLVLLSAPAAAIADDPTAPEAAAEAAAPEALEGADDDEGVPGSAEPGRRWSRFRNRGRFALRGRIDGRGELIGAVPTDAAGSNLEGGAGLDPRLRLSLSLVHEGPVATFSLIAEADVSGEVLGSPELSGEGLPRSEGFDLLPRKAHVAAQGRGWRAAAGLMTSHWGLGLLANDGDHGWTPSSAAFTDPRGGDAVWRAMITRALSEELAFTLAGDLVHQDDTTLPGDVAWQGVMAATWGSPVAPTFGLYLVYRNLEAESGGGLEVIVVDLTARATVEMEGDYRLTLATELALVAGNTTLAPSVDFQRHRVLQGGGVLRGTFEGHGWGVVADLVYASGDQNLDDASQNAFKADRNFDQGLLLFPWVLAAQTGRSVATASNLELVGQPAPDIERLPTRGAVTDTVSFFPRAYYRLSSLPLEFYGGPLLAFAAVPLVDPYNTRMAGGVNRNALDGEGGTFLGLELDLGARYQREWKGILLAMGLEGAMLLPGAALQGPGGIGGDPLFGGRLTLTLGL